MRDMTNGVDSMVSWIGLAIGVSCIAVAIIMWLLRIRGQYGGHHQPRLTLARASLHLLPLALGLMTCSEAVGKIRQSEALWPVLTALFGFLILGCIVAFVIDIGRRQTADI